MNEITRYINKFDALMEYSFEEKHWDSDFFGFKVGEIRGSISKIALVRLKEELRELGYKLLYWKVDSADGQATETASSLSLFLLSTNITMVRMISPADLRLAEGFSPTIYNGPLTDNLKALAISSGYYSRFRNDPIMPPESFERLYTKWINTTLSRPPSEKIFIKKTGELITGFISIILHDTDAAIGLIAVDENFRRNGIGKELVNSGIAYCAGLPVYNLIVSTQMQNTEACALYYSCGFKPISTVNIFHIWL